MLGHQFAYSSAPVRKVKEVQFGIMSPEEIVRYLPLFRAEEVGSHGMHRKRTLSHRSCIRKSWTKPRTGLSHVA